VLLLTRCPCLLLAGWGCLLGWQVAQQAGVLLAGSAACSPSVARHLASAYGDLAPKVRLGGGVLTCESTQLQHF